MRLTIRPTKFGVVVMKNGSDIDSVATQRIRDRRYVELPLVRNCLTFRPILQTEIAMRRALDGLIVVVKFDYAHNSRLIHTGFQPQIFEPRAMFYPDIVLDISAHRGDRMLGLWEVWASIALTRQQDLELIAAGRHVEYLRRLSYQPLASFQWEVVAPIDQRLTPTGELRHPQASPGRLHDVAVSMDDI